MVLTVPTRQHGERVLLTEARRQGQINLHRDYEDGSMYDQSREHSVNRLVISKLGPAIDHYNYVDMKEGNENMRCVAISIIL